VKVSAPRQRTSWTPVGRHCWWLITVLYVYRCWYGRGCVCSDAYGFSNQAVREAAACHVHFHWLHFLPAVTSKAGKVAGGALFAGCSTADRRNMQARVSCCDCPSQLLLCCCAMSHFLALSGICCVGPRWPIFMTGKHVGDVVYVTNSQNNMCLPGLLVIPDCWLGTSNSSLRLCCWQLCSQDADDSMCCACIGAH